MTTIAVRNNTLAADTLVTSGNTIVTYIDKTMQIGDWLAAGAGTILEYTNAIEYLRPVLISGESLIHAIPTHADKSHGSSYSIVLNHPVHGIWEYDGILVKIHREFHAAGSGMDYALGAMEVGADAKTAVQVAMKFDTKTGGEVITRG